MADKKSSWNAPLVITQSLILIFILLAGVFLGVTAGIIVFIDVAFTGHMVMAAGLALVAALTTIKTVTGVAEFFTQLFFPEEWAKIQLEKHLKMITSGLPPVTTPPADKKLKTVTIAEWTCEHCLHGLTGPGTSFRNKRVCLPCYHVLNGKWGGGN